MDNEQPSKAELEIAGTENINWIESQTLQMLGIDVFKVFAYELIQTLNHEWLKERLAQ